MRGSCWRRRDSGLGAWHREQAPPGISGGAQVDWELRAVSELPGGHPDVGVTEPAGAIRCEYQRLRIEGQ